MTDDRALAGKRLPAHARLSRRAREVSAAFSDEGIQVAQARASQIRVLTSHRTGVPEKGVPEKGETRLRRTRRLTVSARHRTIAVSLDPRWTRSVCAGPASTTSRTWTWRSPAEN